MIAGKRTITLHLGAHRTGTTRLQKILDDNADLLRTHGLVAFTPVREGKRDVSTIRRPVRHINKSAKATNPFKRYMHGAIAVSQIARHLHGSPKTILISDEDILGSIVDKKKSIGLYPHAGRVLNLLQVIIGRNIETIILGVRSYDTFVVSAYAMAAVYGKHFPRFDEIRNAYVNFESGWFDLVQTIKQTFPWATVRIWTFEECSVDRQLDILVGSEIASQMEYDANRRVNPSPSEEAINYARTSDRNQYTPDAILKKYGGLTKWDPLTHDEKARLAQRYRQDLECIRGIADLL